MNDFLDNLKEWCLSNPLTEEDMKGVENAPVGFWKGKKQNRYRIYEIVLPDGTIETTNCLQDFCKRHGISQSNMCNVANGKFKQHKGYKMIK